jgi:AcrR family transcriptional regulator
MTATGRHRHVEHGYARGQETRSRIIAAALKLFGELGYAGASTRDIAAEAGVNAPALQYYFDNKEGAYLACVEHIVSLVWEQLSPPLAAAEEVLARNAADEELIEAFCDIQAHAADLLSAVQNADDWRLFMARLQTGAGPALGFQLFHERVTRRTYDVMAAIVGRLLGRPPTDEETLIRAMALNGQMMVFQVMRRSALTTLGWETIDAPQLTQLKRVFREHSGALLRSLAATRSQPPGPGRRLPRGARSARRRRG